MTNYRFFLHMAMIMTGILLFTHIGFTQTENQTALPEPIPPDNSSQEGAPIPMPQIIKLGQNEFQIGTIKINKKERVAIINGEINMSDGPVEYLACSPNGKLHESVLKLFTQPYHIQVALLLLGLVPGNTPIDFQGSPEPPCGDPLEIMVSWEKEGKRVVYPPERLVTNFKTHTIMEKADWVFTGSQILDGQYMAQVEGSIVAIFHDPIAIIDHRSITGADDTLFQANKNLLPPVGTKVVVKISANTDTAIKKRVRCRQTRNENQ